MSCQLVVSSSSDNTGCAADLHRVWSRCVDVDVDECAGALGPCGTATEADSCANTVGSYQCTCKPGYQLASGVCEGI